MGIEQTQCRRCVDACRLGGVELDAAEVFGTDKAVLVGADQSSRRAMVAVERAALEALRDEHVLLRASSIVTTDRWPSRPPKTT